MKTTKHKYLTPLLIFFLLFSISLSYTYISPSLIKVAKIISSENSQYFLDFTNDPALKVFGSIITGKGIQASSYVNSSTGFCIDTDCISSWNSLSGIPSGYCVLFYNATCPSGFDLKENLTGEFLPDYNYRLPITIQENSGNTLTDYQVLIVVDTASLISQGKMNSDCSDIRFVYKNSSGTYEIPYWIEDGTCNTPNTNIWVKVPEIPANSMITLYMFYGNPDATSNSNIDNTFIFGDDFNDGVIDTNKWTILINEGTMYEDGGYLYLHSGSADTWYGPAIAHCLGQNYFAYQIKARVISYDTGTGQRAGFNSLYSSINTSNWVTFPVTISSPNCGSDTNFSARSYNGEIVTCGYSNVPYDDNMRVFNAFVNYNQVTLFLDNSQFFSRTFNEPIDCIQLATRMLAPVNDFSAQYDYVFVRKYSSSEPSFTLGTEEINTANYKIICCKE